MGASRPATIKDVAECAGVSPATVSRALNDTGYVGAETRQRILEAVQRLGYQPDWRARGLRGKEVGLIGLLIPLYSKHLYSEIANAIAARLRLYGHNLILCVSEEDVDIDREYLQLLRDKGVDGILYSHPASGNNSGLVREIVEQGTPIVELVRRRETDLLDAVVNDDIGGAYQMTNYLINKGHRRIAVVQGELNVQPRVDRLGGYMRAMEHAGIPVESELIRMGADTLERACESTEALFRLAEPPTAIFAIGVRMLQGVLQAIHRHQKRVPDDVSVVTFDDLDWLMVYNPPITTVAASTREIANAAVDVLRSRIAYPTVGHAPDCYVLSTRLCERESCRDLRGM